jgi:hypothetical protein
MENSSQLFTDTSRLLEDDRYPLLPQAHPASERHFMKASSAHQSEWTILRTSPVNGLLIGSPDLTAAAVAEMEKGLRQPLMWWSPDQGIDIPDLTTGTLVIRDVDDLDARQQEQLSRWIALHAPGVQVLALAREPLFESVADGRFSAALYYRMNTVVVEVRAAADLP